MPFYENRFGDSNIRAYVIGPDFIKITYKDGKAYLYTFKSTGVKHVTKMMQLAILGKGLSLYINNYVHGKYGKKL